MLLAFLRSLSEAIPLEKPFFEGFESCQPRLRHTLTPAGTLPMPSEVSRALPLQVGSAKYGAPRHGSPGTSASVHSFPARELLIDFLNSSGH